MQFTPVWIVTFSLLCVCAIAIVILARFTCKPVDSYEFSFKRIFPFEVIHQNDKSLPYRILLCAFVAVSFAPLFNLFTSYGQIENIQGISIGISCVFGFAAICFAFLHHFDATHTIPHLFLFVLFISLTLLGNALAAIKGFAVYSTYLKHNQNMICPLVGAIICAVCAIVSTIFALNPRLKNWPVLNKLDSGYERPKVFILAFSEWMTFFLLAIGEISYFLVLLVQ